MAQTSLHTVSDLDIAPGSALLTSAALGLLVPLVAVSFDRNVGLEANILIIFSGLVLLLLATAASWYLSSSQGEFSNRYTRLLGTETALAWAGVFTLLTMASLLVVILLYLMAISAAALVQALFVVSAASASCAMLAFAQHSVGQIVGLAIGQQSFAVSGAFLWQLGLGGIFFVMIAGLFIEIPLWLLVSLSLLFLWAGVVTWLCRPPIAEGGESDTIEGLERKRLRNLGLYQAAFVPPVSLFAVGFGSPQFAPLFACVGFVTLLLGLRKLAVHFGQAN